MDKYYSKGLRHITFADETFGFDPAHLKKLCSLYIKEGFSRRLTWSCQTRAEIITEEWAKIASHAGCVMVSLGIESGDEYIRMNVYNKKFTNKQIIDAATVLRKNKLMFRASIIIGGPEDSEKTIKESVKLIKEIKPVIVTYFLYQSLPKTLLTISVFADKTSKLNYESISESNFFPRLGIAAPLLVTKYLKSSDLKKIMFKISFMRVATFLLVGLRLKGIIFIFDILRQIIYFVKNTGPLSPTCAFIQLELNTTVKYMYNKLLRIS